MASECRDVLSSVVVSEQCIRFGVATETSRAIAWRCWSPGRGRSDVYLSARNLGGGPKVSLHKKGALPHQTGEWHSGFDRNVLSKLVGFPNDEWPSRFTAKWSRPSELTMGVTLAMRVVTPAASVNLPRTGRDSDVLWRPPAGHPRATEFVVVITSPEATVSSWPGRRSMGTDLVGKFSLCNGETVWIVAHETDMPRLRLPENCRARYFGGRTEADLAGPWLRGIVQVAQSDGSRALFDVVVDVPQVNVEAG